MPIGERGEIRAPEEISEGRFVRVGMAMADWSQRWFPDAFIFALIGVAIVFIAGLFTGTAARDLVGYALLYFIVNSILVLFLMWFFARSLAYIAPIGL